MSVNTRILAGAAGFAALVGYAAPAAAQYYPGSGYGNNNAVGIRIGQMLGYGRYPYGNYGYNQYGNQSVAIDQCARAVEARLGGQRGSYYGYGNVPYGGQYGQYGLARSVRSVRSVRQSIWRRLWQPGLRRPSARYHPRRPEKMA